MECEQHVSSNFTWENVGMTAIYAQKSGNYSPPLIGPAVGWGPELAFYKLHTPSKYHGIKGADAFDVDEALMLGLV